MPCGFIPGTFNKKQGPPKVDISELKSKLIPEDFKVEIEMTYSWKLIPEQILIEWHGFWVDCEGGSTSENQGSALF